MADSFGCLANNLPFTYLGVKVGANMARINAWNEVTQKVSSKLSKWKAKTLSVGGRLTLIKSVLGSLPIYYMSLFKVPDGVLNQLEGLRNSFFLGAEVGDRKMTWVRWKKVMAQKQYGGLGVSSLFATNRALLFKWIWRFYSSHFGLWLDVIKAIYGQNGGLDRSLSANSSCSVWISIRKAISNLKSKGVDLMEFCKKVIGNGNNSSFWHEKWIGDECFKVRFNILFNLELHKHVSVAQKLQNSDYASSFRRRPRGGVEECQWNELSHLLSSVVLAPAIDRWSWSLDGNGVFSVKSAREEIDKHFLITSSSSTRWSKLLPIILNVFTWRMFLDKLPTRTNLSNRGMDIHCVLCPVCESNVESRNHLFFECSLASDLFSLMGRWWNIHIPSLLDPIAWEVWFNGLRLNYRQRSLLEASFFSLWWHIWNFINALLFASKKPKKSLIFDNFVSQTWFWVNNRCRKVNIFWLAWLIDPSNAITSM